MRPSTASKSMRSEDPPKERQRGTARWFAGERDDEEGVRRCSGPIRSAWSRGEPDLWSPWCDDDVLDLSSSHNRGVGSVEPWRWEN
jgi:hypothetical protein